VKIMNTANNTIMILSIFLLACLMLVSQGARAGIAGHVMFVNGNVQITNSVAQTRILQKGDVVNESDTVITANDSSAQIKMRDGGYIVIRPDSQLKFDSFIFSGEEDGSERSFFSLLKGGIRAITGLIGQRNKKSYRITTPDSTIGIRGTDHETYVVTADSPLAAVAPVGTYNKVNRGETTITTKKGMISVLPNQMGFAGSADQMPQLQPLNLNLFTVTPSPTPQAMGGKKEVAVRDDTVVDNTIQVQEAVQGNPVPRNQIVSPIKGRDSGPTAGPIVF
jgi:FecR protein